MIQLLVLMYGIKITYYIFNFNDLRFKVDASNFDVIIDTVKELFTSFTDNVDLNAKISDLLEGFKLVVEKNLVIIKMSLLLILLFQF
ncbi:MAG: hypothetical protein L6U99_15170 [Clostridium sp.]|nr:MAG: hypothetical protein L6U99_15170 [Clostridium sp.]